MKKLLKCIATVFEVCIGLGFVVGAFEKKHGKVGWVDGHNVGFYERNVKRPLDFGVSLFALIVLSPIMVVTAMAVRIKLGSPVLFMQERPGLGGRIFTIKKFRTMVDGSGTDEERLTDFGRKLRSTSIDELPELLNILEGSMSVVGPRPLLTRYLSYYTKEEKHRHDVRPGLTGYAQINGRNNLNWDKRFKLDVKYVNTISFINDIYIILKTVKKVISHDDILEDTSKGEPNFAVEREAGRI